MRKFLQLLELVDVRAAFAKDNGIMLILFSSRQVLIPPSDVKEKLQKDAYKPKEVQKNSVSV